jgi:hypothetical protein
VPDTEFGRDVDTPNIDDMLLKLKQSLTTTSTTPIPAVVNVLADSQTVVHVPQQRAFSVTGVDGCIHAVKLFPQESCTCPASTRCCHILAAMRSIGVNVSDRRVVKLSVMRKMSRFEQLHINRQNL